MEFDFPDVLFKLTTDNTKVLKKWLGNRYTRAAFPDEFNNRLAKSRVSKFIEKSFSSKVSHIFFDVEDSELSPEENYELNVLIVLDFDSMYKENSKLNEQTVKEEYEKYFADAFETDGVDVFLRVVTEDEISLKDLQNYKRWDKDSISFSKQNQSFSIDVIDKII